MVSATVYCLPQTDRTVADKRGIFNGSLGYQQVKQLLFKVRLNAFTDMDRTFLSTSIRQTSV